MHITQRGSRRFDVFRDEADRINYLKLFRECCRDYRLRILAYCLMTNHVHYVAVPERLDSVRLVFHRINGAHSQRFNRKYGFVGHLWQERPFSCLLDEGTPDRRSPLRRTEPDSGRDSEACCGLSLVPVPRPTAADTKTPSWMLSRSHSRLKNWNEWLNVDVDPIADQILRDCSATGRPCGDDAFIQQIEHATNRNFTRRKTRSQTKVTVVGEFPALEGRLNRAEITLRHPN
jgi:putative transposase